MDIAYTSNGNKLQQYCYKAIKESKWLVSEQPILQTSKIAYMWMMTKLVLFEVRRSKQHQYDLKKNQFCQDRLHVDDDKIGSF